MFKFYSKYLMLLILSFSLFATCSKDSNPLKDSESDHNHAEAVGLIITSNGAELARYEKGYVTGDLAVGMNEETSVLTINFIAEDGDVFQPAGDLYSLAWELAAADIAEIKQAANDGKWNFRLAGKKSGTTEITFKILHGDHADFIARPIPIQVTE